ncbi:MAG: hypothetical protein K940chlam6_00473 [Chlamydiae bacterium]|nr:hypothetical protein [Chlamydiota bacterium]
MRNFFDFLAIIVKNYLFYSIAMRIRVGRLTMQYAILVSFS